MAFKFTFTDSVVDHSSIFTGISGHCMDDAEITLKGLKLSNTKLFTDLDIPKFCGKIDRAAMSREERKSMQSVLEQRRDRRAFVRALLQHLIAFSEGIAASVVASCLSK